MLNFDGAFSNVTESYQVNYIIIHVYLSFKRCLLLTVDFSFLFFLFINSLIIHS